MEMRLGSVSGMWKAAIGILALCAALPLHAAGDAKQGEQKFYTCYGCHGIEGYRNAYPDYEVPRLRHQHAEYIVAALTEYRAGDRPHATMHAQAASLSDQDLADIAAYLQGPEPIKPTPPAGHAPAVVAACAACHGENGSGVEAPLSPKPPVLAGQHTDYLEQALKAYRNGRRKNAVMAAMAKSIASDADVRIIAEYFGSQHSALATATENSR
jgi:cytochrome c553